jgi:membrane peptidoglycan carboxypeptidase
MGRTLRCGPSPIAYVLVRSITRPRRGALWQLDVAITAYVVSRLFTPDELLRIYAHLIYFGTIDGHDIRGVAAASTVYFRKPPRDLTLTEAATLAGMIRSPNALSPIRYPERAHVRRDFVLAQMLLFGFIDEREYRRAVGEGVRAVASPAAAGRTVSVWRTNPSDAVHAARGTWVANDRRVPPVSKIQPLLLRA